MSHLLIIVAYITFITLGLPDTIFGVTWPSMRYSMNLPLETAGVITMVVTSCTAASSFASGFAVEKIGTGKVILTSNLLTASALLGYSFSLSFWWLLIFSVPLGLGAGAVDAAVNNFVATHYSARHMNWLHCFWGIGALMGPGIATFYLATARDWRTAYQVIAFVLLVVGIIVGLSLSLWKMEILGEKKTDESVERMPAWKLFNERNVLFSILAFPMYIAIEMGVGVWLTSYLIEGVNVKPIHAGVVISLFYASITLGRFAVGFIANSITSLRLLNVSLLAMTIGLCGIISQVNSLLIPGIVLLGLGCAPVFPTMVHSTPRLFGKRKSQQITAYQIGCSYLGGLVLLPIIGLLGSRVSLKMIPLSMVVFTVLLAFIVNTIHRRSLTIINR